MVFLRASSGMNKVNISASLKTRAYVISGFCCYQYLHSLCAKAGLWIDEQIVHRKPCTIEKDDCINDETDKAVRFHGADQPYEGEDEHEVIGKEAKQLSEGVVPVGTEHAVEKVEGVAEEDAAKDD